MATAIAATIDAPSCMAPQTIPSVAHCVASAHSTEAITSSTLESPSPLAATAAIVPHCRLSAHPVPSPTGSHFSPFAAPPSLVLPSVSPSPVATAAHVTSPALSVIPVAVGKSAWHVTQLVPTFLSGSVPRVPIQVAQFLAGSQAQKAKSSTVVAVD